MTTDLALGRLRAQGEVIWENRRYGAVYVVDRPHLLQCLAVGVPVLHLGQAEAVDAVVNATPGKTWLVVSLWCPRDVARARLIGRGSIDLDARLKAWDETAPLPEANLTIDTAEVSAQKAAKAIDAEVRSRRSRLPI
jgi:guanylate kinase